MPKLLVVDDDEDARSAIADRFADEGYDVQTAAGAREAAGSIAGTEFEVVIADMWMDGSETSGLDVLACAKARSRFTQVIVLTGHGRVADAVTSMKNGAFTYLERQSAEGELELLVSQVARAMEFRNGMLTASSDLVEALVEAQRILKAMPAQIDTCIALFNTVATARERLLAGVPGVPGEGH